jgi:hypothetical protein
LRVERIKKDTSESVQSNLVAVPEFPAGIASTLATLSIGAIIIIIAATRMSSLFRWARCIRYLTHIILCQMTSIANYRRVR